jgi:leader peptidase (prepilin peptidase) / N-methyltransferase
VIGAGVALVLAFLFPSIMGQVSRLQGLIRSVLGACAGGLVVFALAFFGKMAFKREAMGEGDIYLLAMIGAFLGWKLALLTFFMAPIFGIIPGLIAKFKGGESEIAYGPYLSLAALVSVFLGEKILGFLYFGV